MASVNITNFYDVFRRYDMNHDRRMNTAETARAAIGYLASDYGPDQSMGRLLGTFAAGGPQQSSFMPDFNGDGQFTIGEVNRLSQLGGRPGQITLADLQAFDPSYQGNAEVPISTLERLAGKKPSSSPPPAPGLGGLFGQLSQSPLLLLLLLLGKK